MMKFCSEMKSVAIFAEKLYEGGVENALQTLLMNIDKERYSLSLFSSRVEPLCAGMYPREMEYAYFFETVGRQDTLFVKLSKKLKNKFRLFIYYHFRPEVFYNLFVKKRFDITIAFIEGYATRIVSGAPSGTVKIAWVHTDLINNHWTDVAYRSLEEEKDCYKKFDQIVCVSQRIQDIMDTKYLLKNKTVVLSNPIDRDRIQELALRVLPAEYTKSDKTRLVTIGSLIPVKGYERLLGCVKRLLMEGFDFELFIVGEGSLRDRLFAFLDANDLRDSVFLTGFLDNPYPMLASADIYVCSSMAEGLNTAITEALILGRPIVSTKCAGTADLLGDSRYGLVVPNDENSLFLGLKRLLEDPALRQRLSVVAYERGLDFSVDKPMNFIYQLLAS